MIELQKVKRDVINYGALKVYTTFLTLSEDEVDPELFAASQLKEIFEKRFDVIKVDMSFVEGEEATVVAKELLVFKLSKCSDSEISYMSNVDDDEGKISSLVLTKSEEEVGLGVSEYSVGGSSGTKLYKHAVYMQTSGSPYPNISFTYFSNSSELTEIVSSAGMHFIKGKGDIIGFKNPIGSGSGSPLNFVGLYNAPTDNAIQSFTLGTDGNLTSNWPIDAETQFISDTVTEL